MVFDLVNGKHSAPIFEYTGSFAGTGVAVHFVRSTLLKYLKFTQQFSDEGSENKLKQSSLLEL